MILWTEPTEPWFYQVVSERSALGNYRVDLDVELGSLTKVREIRGEKMQTFDAMCDEIAAALQFPYYFGYNFNALNDCITDLGWLHGERFALIIADANMVLQKEPQEDIRVFYRILRDAAIEWNTPVELGEVWDRPAYPFHVLLHSTTRQGAQYVTNLINSIPAEVKEIQIPKADRP